MPLIEKGERLVFLSGGWWFATGRHHLNFGRLEHSFAALVRPHARQFHRVIRGVLIEFGWAGHRNLVPGRVVLESVLFRARALAQATRNSRFLAFAFVVGILADQQWEEA